MVHLHFITASIVIIGGISQHKWLERLHLLSVFFNGVYYFFSCQLFCSEIYIVILNVDFSNFRKNEMEVIRFVN